MFARNEVGIGRASADSEQLHVPGESNPPALHLSASLHSPPPFSRSASIPEEPFYSEHWFLALVGALLTLVIVGFIVLLFLANRGNKQKEQQQNGEKKRKRKKSCGGGNGRHAGESAFNTLQLADGEIVSYELYAKRNERSVPGSVESNMGAGVGVLSG